jgi:hypothetical protein
VTALLCAAVLAGCGGDGEEAPREPVLPSGVASDLAAQSDALADVYADGDVCGAAQRADDLRADVIAAIQSGDVPGPFQESLMATANELVDEINCPEAAPPAAEDEEEQEEGTKCDELLAERDALVEQREKKEAKGNGNSNGNGNGNDVEKLDERIAELEEQIQACEEGESGEGDDEEGD